MRTRGFTLIELSIVLVIIGLIVGGVLVGRDLMESSNTRATISQVEKYRTATNTFKLKYNYLPGDVPAAVVTQLGFTAIPTRGGQQGNGDGNGMLEAWHHTGGTVGGPWGQESEIMYFWTDLSANSSLIDGNYTAAGDVAYSTTSYGGYYPTAKLSSSTYVYIAGVDNYMYYSISTPVLTSNGNISTNNPGMSVIQAYNIDVKTDDGLPLSGRALAIYPGGSGGWYHWYQSGGFAFAPNAVSPSSSTCFDTGSNQYSTSQNGGAGINCGISLRW